MPKDLSTKLAVNFLQNLFLIRFYKEPILKPLFFTWYTNLRCNFLCSYCSFANSGETKSKNGELDTDNSIKLLKIIRKECDSIYLTGGEPLIRSDIVEILKTCKRLGFKSISINTNMSLIHKKMEVLNYITNLVASFDAVDEKEFSQINNMPLLIIKQVKENIINCAKLQKEKNFTITINCVVADKTIRQAREVMNFCFANNIRFAIVPAEMDDGSVNPGLKNNAEYQRLIREVISSKEQGRPVFGSKEFLDTIYDFKRFNCYPTLIPHVYPNGDLFYPCQPLLKVAANLLETGSYKKALDEGMKKYGPLPKCKDRCHKACYIEPAIFLENPALVFKEFV